MANRASIKSKWITPAATTTPKEDQKRAHTKMCVCMCVCELLKM